MAPRSASVVSGREDRLVSSLITLMEKGTTPWRREWESSGGHHVNLFTGRAYRGANPILLTLGLHQRGTCLPYWCGAAEARAHGLVPRQGSRAVHVLRPQVKRRPPAPRKPASPAPPAPEAERDGTIWVRYVPVGLFNAADLEGEALQELITARRDAETLHSRPEPTRLAGAETTLCRWPVPVLQGGSSAFYNPLTDRIHLPDRKAFHSGAAFYATWAHEAIHSTGHPSRLGRDLSGVMGSSTYATEELVAELGAVLLGDRLEIGSNVGNHAAYLADWIRLLQHSPQLLYKLLSAARRAADLICPPTDPPGGEKRSVTTPADLVGG
ncbi:MAG: zincin-like metallopeptidase domain-containing protein [Cyanobium sp.]